jgi:GNAT superfamily N-acetyltransferase
VVAEAMGDEGDLVAARLARGCRCFGAWLEGELAGYGWLSTKTEWIGELELEITPRAGEGYIWNCFTLANQRRRGVLRALLAGIRARAHDEGFTRLWIGSVAIPAETAFGPSGFTPTLVFSSEVITGYRWLQVRPVAGADPALVEAAHHAVGAPAGRFLRQSRPRRH